MNALIGGLVIFLVGWCGLCLCAAGLWAWLKQIDKERDGY